MRDVEANWHCMCRVEGLTKSLSTCPWRDGGGQDQGGSATPGNPDTCR